jgi:hypothetical protein
MDVVVSRMSSAQHTMSLPADVVIPLRAASSFDLCVLYEQLPLCRNIYTSIIFLASSLYI